MDVEEVRAFNKASDDELNSHPVGNGVI